MTAAGFGGFRKRRPPTSYRPRRPADAGSESEPKKSPPPSDEGGERPRPRGLLDDDRKKSPAPDRNENRPKESRGSADSRPSEERRPDSRPDRGPRPDRPEFPRRDDRPRGGFDRPRDDRRDDRRGGPPPGPRGRFGGPPPRSGDRPGGRPDSRGPRGDWSPDGPPRGRDFGPKDRPRDDDRRPGGFRPGPRGGPGGFSDRGGRPPGRSFGDRPPRPFGDRPPRPSGDRPSRPYGDRPPRPYGDRPREDRGPRFGGGDDRGRSDQGPPRGGRPGPFGRGGDRPGPRGEGPPDRRLPPGYTFDGGDDDRQKRLSFGRDAEAPKRFGNRPEKGLRGGRLSRTPKADPVEVDRILEQARELFERNFDAALALIGEAVVLDRRRPQAFIMLAAAHEARGDFERAEEAWTRAALKAKAAANDSEFAPEEVLAWRLESLVGRGRVQHARGVLEQAAGTYREALALDEEDPLAVKSALAEIALLLGDLRGALKWTEEAEELSPAGQLVRAFALLESGRPREALNPARLAILRNPYLISALMGEDETDFGFEPDEEGEGQPEAREFAERLEAWLELRPERLEDLAKIATSAPVLAEVSASLEIQRKLHDLEDPAEREALLARIQQIRDPSRLAIDEDQVFAALFAEDEDEDE